jgi:predicted nucleic acid-binding protein
MPGLLYLADTNILLRLVKSNDPEFPLVRRAVHALKARGERLLTLNVRDFARYPGITVVHPQTIL